MAAVAAGTVIGLLVYLAALLAFGVDSRDRFVVSELTNRYRLAISDRC
jgi:hypothetical protein